MLNGRRQVVRADGSPSAPGLDTAGSPSAPCGKPSPRPCSMPKQLSVEVVLQHDDLLDLRPRVVSARTGMGFVRSAVSPPGPLTWGPRQPSARCGDGTVARLTALAIVLDSTLTGEDRPSIGRAFAGGARWPEP
jgi:hypothetical protein